MASRTRGERGLDLGRARPDARRLACASSSARRASARRRRSSARSRPGPPLPPRSRARGDVLEVLLVVRGRARAPRRRLARRLRLAAAASESRARGGGARRGSFSRGGGGANLLAPRRRCLRCERHASRARATPSVVTTPTRAPRRRLLVQRRDRALALRDLLGRVHPSSERRRIAGARKVGGEAVIVGTVARTRRGRGRGADSAAVARGADAGEEAAQARRGSGRRAEGAPAIGNGGGGKTKTSAGLRAKGRRAGGGRGRRETPGFANARTTRTRSFRLVCLNARSAFGSADIASDGSVARRRRCAASGDVRGGLTRRPPACVGPADSARSSRDAFHTRVVRNLGGAAVEPQQLGAGDAQTVATALESRPAYDLDRGFSSPGPV